MEGWDGDPLLWAMALRFWMCLRLQVLWRWMWGWTWEVMALILGWVLAITVHGRPIVAAAAIEHAIDALPVGVWIGECITGTLLGLLAALPGYALLGALQCVAPAFGEQMREGKGIVRFGAALSLTLALAQAGHHLAITQLVATLEWCPIGAIGLGFEPHDASADLVRGIHEVTLLAWALSTPVLLAVCACELVITFTEHICTSSASSIRRIGGWLRLVVAGLALYAAWETYPEIWGGAALGRW